MGQIARKHVGDMINLIRKQGVEGLSIGSIKNLLDAAKKTNSYLDEPDEVVRESTIDEIRKAVEQSGKADLIVSFEMLLK